MIAEPGRRIGTKSSHLDTSTEICTYESERIQYIETVEKFKNDPLMPSPESSEFLEDPRELRGLIGRSPVNETVHILICNK